MSMEIYIKAIGKTAKQMVMVYLQTQMVACTKVNGWMINNMDMELRVGITKKSNTLVTLQMVRKLGKVGLNLKVDIMKVNFLMESSMGKESITFQILANFMKENLGIITWMVKEL